MKITSAKIQNRLVGKRVELARTWKPCSSLNHGAQGTIYFVDDTVTIFVNWDNGFKSKLVPLEDSFKFVDDTINERLQKFLGTV